MLFVSLRDLQWRLRRFIIGVLATGLVFAIALLISGIDSSFQNEAKRAVAAFRADQWVVAEQAFGPFTSSNLVSDSVAGEISKLPGVRAASPVGILHATMRVPSTVDLNLISVVPGGVGSPVATEGRSLRANGEAVVDKSLGVGLGKTLRLAGVPYKIVGRTSGLRFNAGTPAVFITVHDAEKLILGGLALSSAIILKGHLAKAPKGLKIMSNAEVLTDLRRPLKKATSTISFLRVLLWIIAAGIIGSVLYLQALERTRDFAVFKATGVSSRSLLYGIALQAIVLAALSAAAALLIEWALAPTMDLAVEVPASAYIALPIVAVVVGLIASLFGLRRAVMVDPALAFGGA
ncbi:MAG TPA: ABC transporter permease [Acidimicrobiia bacterium]|nr:ABC transporter permease [Acidimicrobiia bacterium]